MTEARRKRLRSEAAQRSRERRTSGLATVPVRSEDGGVVGYVRVPPGVTVNGRPAAASWTFGTDRSA